MSIFRRMGNAIARFMYGRNGMDQLNRALIWVYLAICLVQIPILSATQSMVINLLFDVVLFGMMFVIFFRMFSRNVYKRQGENGKYLRAVAPLKNKWSSSRARHADKDHKYFTCKNCKTICRVPVGKGKVVITCPKCGGEIHGKT